MPYFPFPSYIDLKNDNKIFLFPHFVVDTTLGQNGKANLLYVNKWKITILGFEVYHGQQHGG